MTIISITRPGDVEILGQMAQIAAAAHAPFIAGANPTLMGMDSWRELANPRDLTKIFTAPDYAAWRSLRDSEDAKYLGLAMPRFLSRLPYGAKTNPVEEFDFEEETGGGDIQQVHAGPMRPTRWRSNINRSFKQSAGARAFAASSLAARSKGCPCTPSQAMTAASI